MLTPGALGLTEVEFAAFVAALAASHRIRVQIDVLDRNEALIGPLNAAIVEGAVQVDATANVTRVLELTFLDPAGSVEFAPGSAEAAGVFADNFLAVRYGVFVEDLARWVDVPVFQGPITAADRDDATVAVVAQGKEVLALSPAVAWRTDKIRTGTNVRTAIDDLLRPRGEVRFAMDSTTKKVNAGKEGIAVAVESEPWKIAKSLAHDADRQLFYDGLGRVRLRQFPSVPQFTFTTGPDGLVQTKPKLAFDLSKVRNVVRVTGGFQSAGSNRPVIVAANPADPLSAQSLGRNGKPRWLAEFVKADQVKSRPAAATLGKRHLADGMRADVSVEFDTLPVPILEEADLVALSWDGRTYPFRANVFTLPLTAAGTMSLGFLRRVSLRK